MTQLQAIRKAEGQQVARSEYKAQFPRERNERAIRAAEQIKLDTLPAALWPDWMR